MLRKTSAATFLIVMTLLIMLKHPVLGYCFCMDTYFASDCDCACELVEKPKAQPTDTSDCCESGSCPMSSPSDSEEAPCNPESPCDNCTKHVSIDVGDFLWQNSSEVPSDTELWVAITPLVPADLDFADTSLPASISIRGKPPIVDCLAYSIPLYLRLGVLRL